MSDFFGDFFGGAIGFAEQNSRGIQVITRLCKRLDHRNALAINHLQTGRNDARRNDGIHGIAGGLDRRKGRHDDPGQLGFGHQPDGRFGQHAQHSLGANIERQQIEPWRIGGQSTEFNDLAIHRHDAGSEHVMNRQTIL